ncbi:alpha/beta fold hydrolase, partial [Shewanella sp. 0m-11]
MSIATEAYMTNTQIANFSSEHHLNSPEQKVFWQQVTQATFKTRDDITLAYAKITHPNSIGTIVLSNG